MRSRTTLAEKKSRLSAVKNVQDQATSLMTQLENFNIEIFHPNDSGEVFFFDWNSIGWNVSIERNKWKQQSFCCSIETKHLRNSSDRRWKTIKKRILMSILDLFILIDSLLIRSSKTKGYVTVRFIVTSSDYSERIKRCTKRGSARRINFR